MNAQDAVPTKAELQAYSLGKLDAARAVQVQAYVEARPDCLADLASAGDDEILRHLRKAGDVPAPPKPSLLELAIEAILPVVAGCAGALAGGAEGGLVGVAVGQVAEKAINVFGRRIISRWVEWLRRQPPAAQAAALAQLADVPPEAARAEAQAVLAVQAPQASEADRRAAADYLGAIPQAVRQSLVSAPAGGRKMSPTVSVEDSLSLLQLMPVSLPPYAVPCVLPGTSYQLEELVGCGGFGAVYRASVADMQNLPLAIKFCLDRSMTEGLRREQTNLERLREAGGEAWSARIARLYGYNLQHETPYLVYEFVSGGDLVQWLARRRARTGTELTPAEVLTLIVQVAEGLAFAHERGIVHRDLKPANVLIEAAGTVKLADFGIGGVAQHLVSLSRIGTTVGAMSAAEQASLFRGAGTPLYVDPEQKEGKAPDPRHDLYSLGVTWYQLLVGDVTREMRHGWERELERKFAVPRDQIELLGRCVGWVEERPRSAGEFLKLLPQEPVPLPAMPKPPAVGAVTRHPDAQKWREAVVRATVELEKVVVPSQAYVFVAILSLIFGLPALVLGVMGASLGDARSVACPFSFLFGVGAAVSLLASATIERRRKDRQVAARSAIVRTVEAAQAALSLPPLIVDRESDSLCQVGWRVVREIEDRYLPRDVRARMRFPIATLASAGYRAAVFVNGVKAGEVSLHGGYQLSVDLCCGSHYLVVEGTGYPAVDTGRGVMSFPGEGNYHVEVPVQRALQPKVARLFE